MVAAPFPFFSKLEDAWKVIMLHRLLTLGLLSLAVPVAARPAEVPASPPPPHPVMICVLDQAAMIQQSKLATNEAGRFQQVRQTAQSKFDNDSRTLDADARALDSLRASLPPAVVKARTDDIARRRADLKQRGDQINRELSQLDGALTNSVLRAAGPVIRQVEQERGCSLLIARSALLDLIDPSLDITPAIIERMNAPKPDVPR